MGHEIQVRVKRVGIEKLQIYHTTQFLEGCRYCPNYGKTWACPPNMPDTKSFLQEFSTAYCIGVKISYTMCEHQREKIYQQAQKVMHTVLLELEKQLPQQASSIAAGRCTWCTVCQREQGKPCMKPEYMRYSFSALGFDLGKLAEDELKYILLWDKNHKPPYQVILCALLVKE